jgi:hypothetical protein
MESPVSADTLRTSLPERFLRSLGEVGRKAGVPTIAALVLRSMWVTGEVMRVPAEGRLDRGGALWGIDPRPRTVPTAADAVSLLGGRWLAAHAPMNPKAFATALGIAAGRANSALKALRPTEVQIESLGTGVYLAPSSFATSSATPGSQEHGVWLLPVRDPYVDLQTDGLGSPAVVRAATTRNHGIGPSVLVDGEIVGSWLYDEVARVVTWRSHMPEPLAADVSALIDAEAQRVASFLASEIASATLHTVPPSRSAARNAHLIAGGELAIEV